MNYATMTSSSLQHSKGTQLQQGEHLTWPKEKSLLFLIFELSLLTSFLGELGIPTPGTLALGSNTSPESPSQELLELTVHPIQGLRLLELNVTPIGLAVASPEPEYCQVNSLPIMVSKGTSLQPAPE
jgi:hypothetical protein